MSLVKMYPAKDGSPETTTTALLSDSDTTVTVAELSCFPAIGTEEGNECTLWNDTAFETCEYTAKSAASGAGTLTISRSGTVHSSTSGGAIEWPVGTKIARTYTAYDHNAVKSNIESIDGRVTTAEGTLSTAVSDISSIDGRVTTAEGTLSTAVSDISSIDGRVDTLESTAGTDPVLAALIFG